MDRRTKRRPSRRGDEDYHDPTRGIGGAPPARSALRMRAVLAMFGLIVCGGGAALLAVVDAPYAWIAAAAALALIACIDLAVIWWRLRGEGKAS